MWFLAAGVLLISMGLMESVLQRLPVSPAMFYLPVGYALGPAGFGLVDIEAKEHATLLTILSEIALLVSLFTVGLKLRVRLNDHIWWIPIRLGVVSMVITIGLMAAAGYWIAGLPLGAAILLAAILAPTDPILASDVQIKDAGDRDRIRFGLTGEGGLNDGTTYPFIMLGLALLAVPEAHEYTSLYGFVDAGWGVVAGLGVGGLMGWTISRAVIHLRHRYQLALGMEEFLALGLIGLSYGAAQMIGGIGFIAVFAAGVAMRRIEHVTSGEEKPGEVIGPVPVGEEAEVATDRRKASAYMTETMLGFNQQLEHIAEFVMVLLLGMLLSTSGFSVEGFAFAAFLIVIVRPASVLIALAGAKVSPVQRNLMAWFGIRGIGSLFYLMYVLQYDWLPELTDRFISLVLTVVATSILVHGITSTPLMESYRRRVKGRHGDKKAEPAADEMDAK